MLREKGCYIVDTDILARKAVQNPEVVGMLCQRFGSDIVSGGTLDRRELARRAFATPEGTNALNMITHPEITRLAVEEIHKAEKEGAKSAVIDAALLFESPLTAVCGKTVCVVADKKIRLERIMKRDGISESDAILRINAQPDEEYYKSKSDIVISNNGEDLENQIDFIQEG